MKIAVIGQSVFGQEVYRELRKDGHTVVGVFTIPDKDGKADPLGEDFTDWDLCSFAMSTWLLCLYSVIKALLSVSFVCLGTPAMNRVSMVPNEIWTHHTTVLSLWSSKLPKIFIALLSKLHSHYCQCPGAASSPVRCLSKLSNLKVIKVISAKGTLLSSHFSLLK